jgi:tRNA pseudouridine55 synthase
MSDAEPSGFLNLDKPVAISSRGAVDRVGRKLRTRRVGHAGTLDPAASGVLVIAVGKATRLVEYVQEGAKRYLATFRLGAVSTTDDAEGEITPVPGATPPSTESVTAALAGFVGVILQRPPAYSAIHVGGQRAYDLARRGERVELPERPVRIDRIELIRHDGFDLELIIDCGSGTYIRSIARDLGERLGVGGYMTALCRTAVGPFALESAVALDAWDAEPEPISRLLDLTKALTTLPTIKLPADLARRFEQGQKLEVDPASVQAPSAAPPLGGPHPPSPSPTAQPGTPDGRGSRPSSEAIAVFDEAGAFVGIGGWREGLLKAEKAGFR